MSNVRNRLEHYLISHLVNLSCEFGQIMNKYDILEVRRIIFYNGLADFNLIIFNIFVILGVLFDL